MLLGRLFGIFLMFVYGFKYNFNLEVVDMICKK
eukprot:UN12390